ncbi:MAG TPA: hypothetical protein VFA88_06720 [Gaiellaceae bacterium]|nr:hypothetical protein [Gaiellaceae bacterium]
MAAAGELETEPDPESSAPRVVVDLEQAEIPAAAAARLVGVAPVTMRAWIAAKRVRARHEGRLWLVRVEDLLGDPRFPSQLRGELLGFEQAERKRRPRPLRELPPATRPLYVRLAEHEYAALAQLRRRYGTARETIATALLVLAADDPRQDELARVRAKLDDTRGELERARAETKKAQEQAKRLPRSGWCSGCERAVAWDELELDERAPHGKLLVHRHAGISQLTQGARVVVAVL